MKLELKHLAPYLPYGLKIKGFDVTINGRLIDLMVKHGVDRYTPILRPLSDLTKEIEHNGEKFVPIEIIKESQRHLFLREDLDNHLGGLQYSEMQKLLEHHFDVFGLIDNGLAIDINKMDAI